MSVIIDGHNLLWFIQNAEEDKSISDIALCRVLDAYFRLTGQPAEIIFDGPGPPPVRDALRQNKSEFDTIRHIPQGMLRIDVTFSGRSCDCDTLIENRIRASSAPKGLTIVSDDRRLRDAAKARKAKSVRCYDFWEEVKKRLSKQRKRKEPAGKRKGLTESETELWLKTFGLKQ